MLDITPGMLMALIKERQKELRAQSMDVRFLATVISQHIAGFGGGEGINYMEEPEKSTATDVFGPGVPMDDPDFKDFMFSRPRTPGSKVPRGANDQNPNQATQGTPAGDEGGRVCGGGGSAPGDPA